MPSVYQLKPAFQRLLRPLVRALAARGVTANQATVSGVVLSIACGVWLWLQPTSVWALAAVPATLFLRMVVNAMDGMLAREHNMQSRLGATLNELGDVISDAALYLPFARVPGVPVWGVIVVVVLAGIAELAGVMGQVVSGERRYDGPMGKSDRAVLFGVMAIALALGWQGGMVAKVVLAIAVLLLVMTVYNRVRRSVARAG